MVTVPLLTALIYALSDVGVCYYINQLRRCRKVDSYGLGVGARAENMMIIPLKRNSHQVLRSRQIP